LDREAVVRLFLCAFFFLSFLAGPVAAKESFESWLNHFARYATTQGVSPATLGKILPRLKKDPMVERLDRKQPEKNISFKRYYDNVVTPWRIKEGKLLAREHESTFRAIARDYGISAPMILALWAVESGYGNNMGSFNIFDSLATLAYDGRRATFFRGELVEALKILDEEKLDYKDMQGSWAGALGQCQFMPSTFRRYAVDGNQDGKRDIWEQEEDVLTSIANYLSAESYRGGAPWGREVKLTKRLSSKKTGLEIVKTIKEWKRLGVQPADKKGFPDEKLKASLLLLDGTGGRSFLVYDNFRALLRWNRSTYFATSVGLLADALDGGP
jgi:membrane-bound lytic murein transglycosylase B